MVTICSWIRQKLTSSMNHLTERSGREGKKVRGREEDERNGQMQGETIQWTILKLVSHPQTRQSTTHKLVDQPPTNLSSRLIVINGANGNCSLWPWTMKCIWTFLPSNGSNLQKQAPAGNKMRLAGWNRLFRRFCLNANGRTDGQTLL